MSELFAKLSECIEFGKVNLAAPYPPNLKGQDGSFEITQQLIDAGVTADEILNTALIDGMNKVGKKFRDGVVFVPQVLMSAKAMNTAMELLEPLMAKEAVAQKGTFIIGTVQGDLHDIGKNLVSMMVKGNGFNVVDLGTDVSAEKYIAALEENPGAYIGLSALLTTTMINMEKITAEIKAKHPEAKVLIGGAPVTQDFCDKINADSYNSGPQGVVEYLNLATA